MADQSVASEETTPRELELEERIKRDQFDPEAWEGLIELFQSANNVEKLRFVYTRVLDKFPFAHAVWVKRLELEEAAGNQEEVKSLLSRIIKTTLSVDVWVFYLSWLKRTRLQSGSDTGRAEIRDAFEKACRSDSVGYAMEAGIIWRMYIDFLNDEPENTPYEQGQKMDALRQVYRKALKVPIRGLDAIWKEYQAYETSKHQVVAKQLLEEVQKDYAHSAEVLKDRENVWKPLLSLKKPANWLLPRKPSAMNDRNHVDQWMRMLTLEKSNPEQIPLNEFRMRVRLAFHRALVDLYFHVDAWFAFYEFEKSVQDIEASITVLTSGLRALPDSELLHLVYADALEQAENVPTATMVLDMFLARHPSPLVYVHRMRLARRTDGIAAAREIFRKARKLQQGLPEVYCASAEMELALNRQPEVARKILDLALKRFPTSTTVIHFYIDLVLGLNDEFATREVFERILTTLKQSGASNDAMLEVVERYRDFARDRSTDTKLLESIERRMQTELRSPGGLMGAVHRYICFGRAPLIDGVEIDVRHRGPGRRRGNSFEERSVPDGNVTPESEEPGASAQAPEEDASIPPFLRKLASILPRRLHGITQMDADFVLRKLAKDPLPPAPTRSASGDAEGAAATSMAAKKRRTEQLGLDGAPPDAFKQRQKRSRV